MPNPTVPEGTDSNASQPQLVPEPEWWDDGTITDTAPFAMVPEWLLAACNSRAVHLYALLHRYAGKNGGAYPGRRTLAKQLACSPTSVDRAVAELKAAGALRTKPRVRPDGSQSTNDYVLYPHGQARTTHGDTPHHQRVGVSPPVRSQEREPGNESQVTTKPFARPAAGGGFDAFWQVYPRREAKGAARKAWDKAVAKATPEVIIEGAKRYAADPNRDQRYTAHAATWLNGERWGDDPLPSRIGAPQQPRFDNTETRRAEPGGRIRL